MPSNRGSPTFTDRSSETESEPFYFSKWLTFSASAIIMLSSGLAYTFSIYSENLKERFNYTQTEIAGVGTACNIGGYLAIFAGLFYDGLRRWNSLGPVLTVMVGILFQLGGYLGIWLAAHNHYHIPYWGVLGLAVIACNGQTWFETAGLVTTVRNFETERGTVIGILKALLGLSASLYTTIYFAFFEPKSIRFLLALAIGPSSVALLFMIFLNYVPYIQVEPHTKTHGFHMAYTAVISLAAYQTVIAIAHSSTQLDFWGGILVSSAEVVLLVPFLSLPFIFGGIRSKRLHSEMTNPDKASQQSTFSQPASDRLQDNLPPESLPLLATPPPESNQPELPSFSLGQCLAGLDFWLLLFIHLVCTGAGLTLLNNVNQMVIALDPSPDRHVSRVVYVSIFSIANCLGRLISGYLPDKLLLKRHVPRTVPLIIMTMLTLTAALLNAFSNLNLLNGASFLSGFAFGAGQGLAPSVTSELFGLKNFASNYSALQLGPALGSYLLATLLAGTVYQRSATRHGDQSNTCYGTDCFRLTFVVISVLSGIAVILSFVLWLRTRTIYRAVIEQQVTERAKRGIRAEFRGGQEILETFMRENRMLESLLGRGRALVGNLQSSVGQLPEKFQEDAPELAHTVEELTALVDQANVLLPHSSELRRRYRLLPSLRSVD